ncbi:pentapeptide repeat-containing protein [Actinomadura sp. NPDC048021]|uniref:pentapeptide repeat-containing protein n=2 Tax=unclassified Actinomadura TaxID=2626254 RepID=UPI0033E7704F
MALVALRRIRGRRRCTGGGCGAGAVGGAAPGQEDIEAKQWNCLSEDKQVDGVYKVRKALMQLVTGVASVGTVVFTAAGLRYTARTLAVTRQEQITDRYTKAIEQLGSHKPEVRMGAIYALQRLMDDSDRDRGTILADLTNADLTGRADLTGANLSGARQGVLVSGDPRSPEPPRYRGHDPGPGR